MSKDRKKFDSCQLQKQQKLWCNKWDIFRNDCFLFKVIDPGKYGIYIIESDLTILSESECKTRFCLILQSLHLLAISWLNKSSFRFSNFVLDIVASLFM